MTRSAFDPMSSGPARKRNGGKLCRRVPRDLSANTGYTRDKIATMNRVKELEVEEDEENEKREGGEVKREKIIKRYKEPPEKPP